MDNKLLKASDHDLAEIQQNLNHKKKGTDLDERKLAESTSDQFWGLRS